MTIKVLRFKRSAEPIVIELDVKQCVTAAYIKVTEKSLTMWDSTDVVDYEMFRLGLFLVTQIVSGNPHGVK